MRKKVLQMKKAISYRLPAIAFLSGAASLVYELVCFRYLSLILGSTAYVAAVVVGCYMAGLSAGGMVFGNFADKNPRLALLSSLLGFAVFCGVSPLLYRFVDTLSFAGSGAMGARVFVCFLFMLPATLCAGGVVPCLIKAGHGIKRPAGIYAAGTLGSVIGALVCGYLLIQLLGISRTAILAAGMSLLCGALAFWIRRREPEKTGENRREPSSAKSIAVKKTGAETPVYTKKIVIAVIAAYCVSGFAAMIFEVFQTKILTLFFRDSVYDFTIILTVFLVGAFLGNMLGGRIARKNKNLLLFFALTQIMAGAAVILDLYVVTVMPGLTYDLSSPTAMQQQFGGNVFLISNLMEFAFTALTVLLPSFLWGMGFPLVNKIAVAGETREGRVTGFTIGINTLFCAAGSLLSAFWLINVLGIRGLIILAGLCCIVSGAALAGLGFRRHIQKAGPLGYILPCALVAAAGLMLFMPRWDRFEMSTSFLKPGQNVTGIVRMRYYNEDIYGITSVAEFLPYNQKFLTTNRRYCQNSSLLFGPEDHQRLGIIPLLIHQYPTDVLMVGLGAGITLRGAQTFPGVQIDCVEIAESVVRAAEFFAEENNNVLSARNVHMIYDDGRNYIKNTRKDYDVIIADIFFPMSSGSSNLFSREYYQMCKNRLKAGGIMVQWIPAHQFSKRELDITIKTFASVFENCQLWYGMIGDSVPVVGLVGSKNPIIIDGERLFEIYADQALLDNLTTIALDDAYMFLSHYITDISGAQFKTRNVPVNTDDHPILEYINPGNSDTPLQRGMANMDYVARLKETAPKIAYYVNIDEEALEDYNKQILEYVSSLFSE